MRPRIATIVAWSWFGLLVILGGYVMLAPIGADPPGPNDVLIFLSAVLFALMGAVLMSLRPGTVFGTLLLLEGTAYTVAPDGLLPALTTTAEVSGWPALLVPVGQMWMVMFILPILYLLLLFPTGRPPGPRWRWLGRGYLIFILYNIALVVVGPQWVTLGGYMTDNPLHAWIGLSAATEAWLQPIVTALFVGMLVTLIPLSAVAPFVRYRSAGAVERAQLRWLLYAGALYAAGFILGLATGAFEEGGSRAVVATLLFALGFTAIPVAVAIAVLRYRLFDVDVIIRRTLQYGVLTVILGGLYAGSVLLFQTLLGPLIGGADSPPVVIVTTLILAALFNPLRIRVQRFIDRRFYRRKVNAEQALARFSAFARDEVDLEELRRAMFGVVGETLQPERMGLWLKAAPEERPMGGPR